MLLLCYVLCVAMRERERERERERKREREREREVTISYSSLDGSERLVASHTVFSLFWDPAMDHCASHVLSSTCSLACPVGHQVNTQPTPAKVYVHVHAHIEPIDYTVLSLSLTYLSERLKSLLYWLVTNTCTYSITVTDRYNYYTRKGYIANYIVIVVTLYITLWLIIYYSVVLKSNGESFLNI